MNTVGGRFAHTELTAFVVAAQGVVSGRAYLTRRANSVRLCVPGAVFGVVQTLRPCGVDGNVYIGRQPHETMQTWLHGT